MAKQKTIPELQAEIAVKERQIAQLQHKQESVAPLAKVLTETEFYAFAEKALALPEVKGLLMEAVNEHNKNEFGGD